MQLTFVVQTLISSTRSNYRTDVNGRPLNPPLQIRSRKKMAKRKFCGLVQMLLNFIKLAGWQLAGWKFFQVGISWVGYFQVAIFRVGVILGGNFLWWGFSGWELSGRNHPGGNFPGGSFHVTFFLAGQLKHILTSWKILTNEQETLSIIDTLQNYFQSLIPAKLISRQHSHNTRATETDKYGDSRNIGKWIYLDCLKSKKWGISEQSLLQRREMEKHWPEINGPDAFTNLSVFIYV